ncbi:MAG: hypothetical protein WAY93_05680 [Atopobiaceae bacterium]|jgi:hypothetical protein|nr:hypothetical protein [Atopobiaceae bacterium]
MSPKDIQAALEKSGLRVCYRAWAEGREPELPYVVWYFPQTDNLMADGAVYERISDLNVELYSESKDFESERALERVLTEMFRAWQKSESWLESERMYEQLYEGGLIVDDDS